MSSFYYNGVNLETSTYLSYNYYIFTKIYARCENVVISGLSADDVFEILIQDVDITIFRNYCEKISIF